MGGENNERICIDVGNVSRWCCIDMGGWGENLSREWVMCVVEV